MDYLTWGDMLLNFSFCLLLIENELSVSVMIQKNSSCHLLTSLQFGNQICAFLAVLSNEDAVYYELLYPYSLFSQNIHYNTTFYASPVVLVSVHHYYNRNMKNVILPENNIVTAWVEVRYLSTDFLKIILWSSNAKRRSISSQRVSFFSRKLA